MKQLAAAIPFNAAGEGLFDVNIKHNGYRVTPIGGKVDDADPSPQAAAIREGWEEFRLRMKVIGDMGLHDTVSKGEGPFPVHTFACEIVDDSETVCDADGTIRAMEPAKSLHAVWINLHDLFTLGARGMLAPNLHSMIRGWRMRYEALYGQLPDNLTLKDLYMTVNAPAEKQADPGNDDDPFGNGMVRVRFRATAAVGW
jgi:8-oxo-dGTP pyrophosphatase MutT (NUDIX family)